MQNILNWLIQKFVPRSHVVIFRNKRTWSTPLDPKHEFRVQWGGSGAFHSVWVHLGSFRNCKKLGAKRGELVQLIQKFVPRSQVVIFRNERTWSTPLDYKLMFRCISWCLIPFGIVSLPYETWGKLGWSGAVSAKICTMKLRLNFSQWVQPVQPIGP